MDKNTIIKAAVLIGSAVIIFGIVRTLSAPAPVQPLVQETKVIEVEYSKVLAAAVDLPLGSRINVESLAWIEWPAEAVTPSLITQSDDAEAMENFHNAIVRSGIVGGEPINPAKLVVSGGAGVMAALLNPGMRAVTTRISPDTAAGGFIQPGDRVDIILTQNFPIGAKESGPGEIIVDKLISAQTIFENVRVLAIDQTFSTTAANGADIIGSTATFELSPVDVEILQEAESSGDLSLTLRGLTGSNAYSRSAASVPREVKTEGSAPEKLTLYRSGQAQTVAIEGLK